MTRSRNEPNASLVLALSTVGVLAATCAWGQAARQTSAPTADPSINAQFLAPDVKALVDRLETESREVFARRESIVDALSLKPGMAVADVGAGTGLFSRLMAERVGATGMVYAVDISEPLLRHIEEKAKASGRPQIRTVRATQESTGLAPDSIDVAFLCDTYHHFERPAEALASIRKALRPNGSLFVVEFDRAKAKPGSFIRTHVRADQSVFAAEIRAAGFEPLPVSNPPALSENVFLKFRKPAGPSRRAAGPGA